MSTWTEDFRRFAVDLQFRLKMRLQMVRVPETPHLDEAALPEFLRLQRAARRFLEFGSGGSTLQAARLNLPTVSVESDEKFAEAVRARLPRNAPVEVIHAAIGLVGEWGIPTFRSPTSRRLRRWRSYVNAPFSPRRDEFPDLVLIDGRFRVACALEVARRAQLECANTTIFFDDYFDRPHYFRVERWLGAPKRVGRAAIFEVVASRWDVEVYEDDVFAALPDWS